MYIPPHKKITVVTTTMSLLQRTLNDLSEDGYSIVGLISDIKNETITVTAYKDQFLT